LGQNWLNPGSAPNQAERKIFFTQGFTLAQFNLVIIDLCRYLFFANKRFQASVCVEGLFFSDFLMMKSHEEVFCCYIWRTDN
jgi:hypothetical protein